MASKRILSGMRPTGNLHLGNALGALSNWVALQDDPKNECFYMIADWHALTTDYEETSAIESSIEEMAMDWLSAGLDPAKSVIFRQSWVPEHSELYLILSMITPLSWLERNPTYKEQMNEIKEKEISTHGFLGYPVLQAADILLYHASHVPVGEDQLPHLELTREIARRFNFIYKKEILREPQALLSKTPKVPGLDGRKMSKSYGNCLYLADSASDVKKKVNSMFTDPKKIRANDPGHPRPGPENPTGCVVFALHEIYQSEKAKNDERARRCETGELGCVPCKQDLGSILETALSPVREKRSLWSQDRQKVREILSQGSRRARTVAEQTLQEIREAIRFKPGSER